MSYWKITLKNGEVIDDKRVVEIRSKGNYWSLRGEREKQTGFDKPPIAGLYLIPIDNILKAEWKENPNAHK